MKNRIITFLTTTSLFVMTYCAFAITPPDEQPVAYNSKGIPYCANKGHCDIPEDCRNNEPPPQKGYIWTCNNLPGFCIGKCKQVPIPKALPLNKH